MLTTRLATLDQNNSMDVPANKGLHLGTATIIDHIPTYEPKRNRLKNIDKHAEADA